jgi:DNA-binding MarR family transcriptional regulator
MIGMIMEEIAVASEPSARTSALLRELIGYILQRSAGETLRVMNDANLSMPQMVTLHMLRKCGPFTISVLAERLRLSLAATSHLVERMVQLGFVARTEDASDRRQKQLALTPAGHALIDRLVAARLAETDPILTSLPDDLREQLEGVLELVLAQLRLDTV